jgi:hypothetical protein
MRDVYTTKGRLPVSRLFLYYAMHLLVTRHPREGLSAQAAKALDEYLAASRNLAPPREEEVPGWNAAFEESDWRIRMKDRLPKQERISLEHEPKLRIALYPESLDEMENWGGTLPPEVVGLYQKLRAFLDLAYP